MTTFSNGEQRNSIRTKINASITTTDAMDQGVATTDSPTFVNVSVTGTVDGRDVAADGTKLDGIEALADVTDTTNVTAAGALMDSEVTNLAAVKAFDPTDYATAAQGTLADSAVQPNDSPTFAGLTTTGNASFGDNDKAIFGAGSDLQIYHDGLNSYVSDQGAGSLYLQGTSLFITDSDGNEFIRCSDQGSGGIVYLKNLGATKLATTSTGVDVTGTVTADGLTVDGTSILNGDITMNTGTPELRMYSPTSVNGYALLANVSDTVDGGLSIKDVSGNVLANFKSNGDISFYEDTGTTPKFFWDASAESLGIGTTTLGNYDKELVINSLSSTAALRLAENNVNYFDIYHDGATNSGNIRLSGAGGIRFIQASTERMRIDSSGNVGIGTSSPTSTYATSLHVNTSGNNAGIRLTGGTSTAGFDFVADSAATYIYNRNNTPTLFATNGTERMRIDSSGNLLVGKTSSSISTEGVDLRADGQNYFVRDGGTSIFVNRLTSDGTLVDFRKDGSTVGSIGVGQSSDLYIGTSDTGILTSSSESITPWNPSTNVGRDDAIDLGTSDHRFQDLYLSGGVYLGGTGSANKLDDYETGTWTPTLDTVWSGPSNPLNSASGAYTKIGNLVTCVANLDFAESGTNIAVDHRFAIGSLPFLPDMSNITGSGTVWVYDGMSAGNNSMGFVGTGNASVAYIYISHTDGTTNYADIVRLSFSYFTTA